MARGKPVVIEFAASVRDYLRGTRDVERATEDIADELKDAARESDRFERDFTDAMKDAERQAERSSRSIEQDFEKTPGKLGEIGEDAGGELTQGIGEAISSGDVEGLISGVLGGVVSGLKGPLGLAAAAIGGVAVVGFQRWQAEVERLTELSESRVDAMLERLGRTKDELDAAFRNEQYEAWVRDNLDNLAGTDDLLRQMGISADEYGRKLFEGGDEAEAMLDRIRAVRDANKEVVTQGDRTRVVYNDVGEAANDILTQTQALVNTQDEVNEKTKTYDRYVGDVREGIYGIEDAWNLVIDRMRRNSKIDIQGTINWYNTGPGAAYVDPRNANYSPGHVAISNLYTAAGRAD